MREWLKLLFGIAGILTFFAIVFFILNSAGLIGQTVVEREVFKRSYQYKEARTSAIATMEAQLAEIEVRLMSDSLPESTRAELEAQRSFINIQLRAERARLNQ